MGYVDPNQTVLLTAGARVQVAGTVEDLVLDSSVLGRNLHRAYVVPGGDRVYRADGGLYVMLIDTAFANRGAKKILSGETVFVLPESLFTPVAKLATSKGGPEAMEPIAARKARDGTLPLLLLVGLAVGIVAFRFA